MSVESQLEIQTALYTALQGVTNITAKLADGASGIFDYAPKEAAQPYIVLGESRATPMDTQIDRGLDVVVTLHIYSQYRGFKELKEIMAEIYTLLHEQTLTLTGQTLILMRQIFSDVRTEGDGETRHGIMRFQIMTEPTI